MVHTHDISPMANTPCVSQIKQHPTLNSIGKISEFEQDFATQLL